MKKQNILTLILLFSITLLSLTLISADVLKTSCGILTSPNTRYYMTSDIGDYESSICFSFDQQNQTLDCQGHSINGDVYNMLVGISVNYEGGKVMNCRISGPSVGIGITSGSTTAGIFNVNITNNTFSLGDCSDCVVGQGIRRTGTMTPIFNSEISYNSATALVGSDCDNNRCADESFGISLDNSNNNRIFGNRFDLSSSYIPTYGINIVGNNNIIKDNFISGTYYGGLVMDSHQNSSGYVYNNNTIINLTQSNSLLYGFKSISEYFEVFNSSFKNNKYGIWLGGVGADEGGGGGRSNFTNILINNSNTSIYLYLGANGWSSGIRFKDLIIGNSTDWDVYDYRQDGTSTVYFLNATYNISKEFEFADNLYRQWYYSAYVNDSLGNAVSGANVTAYDVFGTKQFNIFTNPTGDTNQTSILDYINNAGTKTYYSNYTIKAIDSSGHQSSHSLNITQVQNYQDKFQLSCWSWLNRLFDYPSICGSDIDSALKEIF